MKGKSQGNGSANNMLHKPEDQTLIWNEADPHRLPRQPTSQVLAVSFPLSETPSKPLKIAPRTKG